MVRRCVSVGDPGLRPAAWLAGGSNGDGASQGGGRLEAAVPGGRVGAVNRHRHDGGFVGNRTGKGTVERLHQLAAHAFRPQDCGLIDGYSDRIEGWVLAAAALLGDTAPVVALRLPCPACGEQFVYRQERRRERAVLGAAGVRGRVRMPGVSGVLGTGSVRVAGEAAGMHTAAGLKSCCAGVHGEFTPIRLEA